MLTYKDNDDPNQPGEFKLLVEERRIIESVAGNEHLEIQWRLATLRETKAVVTQYHKYLKENSLIKSVFKTAMRHARDQSGEARPRKIR